MEYPDFESDILIYTNSSLPPTFIEKLLIEKLEDTDLSIELKQLEDKAINIDSNWASSNSILNFLINDNLLKDHWEKDSDSFKAFLAEFLDFAKLFTKFSSMEELVNERRRTLPFSVVSAYYKVSEDLIIQFHFDLSDKPENYIEDFKKVLETISLFNQEGDNDLKDSIDAVVSPKKTLKHFIKNNDKWEVLNPLVEIGSEINNDYRKNKDFRIKKPHIIMNKENFNKYFVFDKNWVLVFDEIEVLMTKPNDVSIYSNISDQNLQKAIDHYTKHILPKDNFWFSSLPNEKKQSEFYDYFELIITSVIFAYTALEAFANICILDGYEYSIEKSGVTMIYSKEAIERKFSLRDKFKVILKQILSTTDPTKEDWWNYFIELEEIRNEIIHTKQVKSENRYSKLLSKRTFTLIEKHKEIIEFYGSFISNNKKELLDEYPYNFGYDDFVPGLMSAKNYYKTDRSLRNVTLGDEEE